MIGRLLPPIGAVLVALAVLAVVASALAGTSLSDESKAALLSALTSLLLLGHGVALWRRLPDHERRLTVAPKGSWRSITITGVLAGIAVVAAAGAVIAAGAAFDPVAERRLEETLTVLAPLGEELLFRGLMLRARATAVLRVLHRDPRRALHRCPRRRLRHLAARRLSLHHRARARLGLSATRIPGGGCRPLRREHCRGGEPSGVCVRAAPRPP